MPTPAELTVSLAWDGCCVHRVSIRARGGVDVSGLCTNRSAAEVAALLPRLYSVCAAAQGAASVAALAAAAGHDTRQPARERALHLETVHEHLWRMLVDWPQLAGEEPRHAAFLPVRAALAAAQQHADAVSCTAALAQAAALADDEVYGMPAARWLRIASSAALRDWAEQGATLPARLLAVVWREQPGLGRSHVALMPEDGEALRAALPGVLGAPQPQWQGEPAETGALARQQTQPLIVALRAAVGDSVLARLAARLLELARLLVERPQDGARPPRVQGIRIASGEGYGAVQSARGLLLHHARLTGETVRGYRVIAPTDWNFAPGGPLASGLLGTEAGAAGELEARARLAVLALDPCVSCSVEIGDA